MMNESAAGWESPFYVAALGRCSRAHLGDELVSGLFQYLTGAQAYNTRCKAHSSHLLILVDLLVLRCTVLGMSHLVWRDRI